MGDNIVEGDEMFTMRLNEMLLPHRIRTGPNSSAIGVLKDSNSKHVYIRSINS